MSSALPNSFNISKSGLIPHETRRLIHNELLKQFTLAQLLEKKNKIFYELCPLQDVTQRIKERASFLLDFALSAPKPWESFVRSAIMEFWSYILANVCNEDTAVVIDMSEQGVDTGIALQISYSIGVGSNEQEFRFQESIYLNLFNVLQSALDGMIYDGAVNGVTQAFSTRKIKEGSNEWVTFLGFTQSTQVWL
jgi:hypothetical protein